jgi:transcriptional regulatory protein LevR
MTHTGKIEWTLTKSRVENELGYEIDENLFSLFAKHFQNNFAAQFDATLEMQASNWDEIKDWEL